uniref:Uncharacterized protein n=1 Tax=Glossina austeni TaxID=7395 RepID=A0A1A9UHD4_GLOAU
MSLSLSSSFLKASPASIAIGCQGLGLMRLLGSFKIFFKLNTKEQASLSRIKTDRSWPFISKNTSRSPLGVKSSAMARVFKLSVLPFCKLTSNSSPTLGPIKNIRFKGGSFSPGRPSTRGISLRTRERNGSGKPPWGVPIEPCKNSTTDLGKDSSSAFSNTWSAVSLFWTMNWAKSPTTLEEGVTFIMSPKTLPDFMVVVHSKGAYKVRVCSQNAEYSEMLPKSNAVSEGVPCRDATIAPMLGWEVIPDIESTATSTTSAPASAQANIEATPAPEVS